jgi:hypothetical protein
MSGSRLGAALAAGVALALAIDLILQIALDAVRIQPSRVDWQAVLVSKGVWMIAVAIAGAISPWLLPMARSRMTWRDAYHTAGTVLLAAPVIWTAATVLVFIAEVPFTQSSFYAELFTRNAPWVLGGITLRAIAGHVST